MAPVKTLAGAATLGLLTQGCVIVAGDFDEMHHNRYSDDHPGKMVVVDEADVTVREAPPHGAIGMSTAFRISDAAPDRSFEFRKRTLDVGAAVGVHRISHDEVYYVLSGRGLVESDGETAILTPGMAAYLYDGSDVGIRQMGLEPLTIIIAYPLDERR